MYASRVKDKNLTFAVSGKLWQRSLVMVDKETESLWSHLLGEAMDGELKGTTLESLPSVITDWASWLRDHPQTTVLDMSQKSHDYDRSFYARRGLQEFVLGMVVGGRARSWPLDKLAGEPVVNDEFQEFPMLVAFDRDSVTTYVYDRRIDDRLLTFKHQTRTTITDEETGSEWDVASGRATKGPLKGKQLKPLIGILSLKVAWSNFHPDSSQW